jgi:hypothetical protein
MKTVRKEMLCVPALAIALLVSGCGYTLVGRASNIPEDIEKVYVEPLANATQRLQVEQILTAAISDEMVTRRRFEIVNSAEGADAILRGTVLSFTVRPVTFGAGQGNLNEGLAASFEVSINADMRFERPAVGGEDPEVVWKNSRYVFRADYQLEGETGVYFDRENIAIEEISESFAKTLVTDLLEGF